MNHLDRQYNTFIRLILIQPDLPIEFEIFFTCKYKQKIRFYLSITLDNLHFNKWTIIRKDAVKSILQITIKIHLDATGRIM